ncbi:MAG: YbbR-like domain-containing protein [Lawsonibacter sp.]
MSPWLCHRLCGPACGRCKGCPPDGEFLPGGGATADDITYEINPKSLIVSGAESDMESLNEISLGSVDLSKVVGTNTFTFPIDLDASLENVTGSTSATVTVTVMAWTPAASRWTTSRW